MNVHWFLSAVFPGELIALNNVSVLTYVMGVSLRGAFSELSGCSVPVYMSLSLHHIS